MKTVGIIGGMGPEATVLLMQKLLAAVPACDDADHIPLIVHQNTAVPSRIKRLIEGRGEDPGPVLAQMARGLTAAGADALAMPCNTAHAYASHITAASALPFLDMRQVTIDHLTKALPQGARIGMLSSPAVQLAGVFDDLFEKAAFTPVFVQDKRPLLDLIRQIKAGDSGPSAQAQFYQLAATLHKSCDHLLVACTELSLLTATLGDFDWTDSLDCLTSRIVAFAQAT